MSDHPAGERGAGRLVVVGTPIGNLGDLSPRARAALSEADAIYCEDTRRTRALLSALAVPAPRLVRMDAHAEAASTDRIVSDVSAGLTVIMVSDAGMPAISDPGSLAVAAVSGAGHAVEVVPGPTAVATALAVSGLPASRYRFEGFLPRKGSDRARVIAAIVAERATSVIYEAPTRVRSTIEELARECGPARALVVARELTKLHEEVWRGSLSEAVEWIDAADPPRGEWVLVLGGAPPEADKAATTAQMQAALRDAWASGLEGRDAVAAVAAGLSVPKRTVYDVAVALKRTAPSVP